MERLKLSDWQVVNLRLTTFHPTIDIQRTPEWYQGIFGREPENILKRREVIQADGPFEDWHLLMVIPLLPLPQRIEWQLVADPDQASAADFLLMLSRFRGLVTNWIGNYCPEVADRFAFGCVVQKKFETKPETLKQLQAYLPDVKIDPSVSDFLYQINRQRTSTVVRAMPINRLCKWATVMTGHGVISFSGIAPQYFQSELTFASQVELDINSAAEYQGHLSRGEMLKLFDEFSTMGQEILKEGDIP